MLNEYLITPGTKQRRVSAETFPRSFGKERPEIHDLVADLCEQFQFDRGDISVELVDRPPVMPEPEEHKNLLPFESDSLIDEEGQLTIYLAQNLTSDTNRLIYRLVLEFISFHAHLCGAEFEDGDELEYFLHLAAIYYGWGILVAQQLDGPDSNTLNEGSGLQETAIIPQAVFAYGLAVFNKLNGERHPEWQDLLPIRVRQLMEQCSHYLAQTPDTIFVGERMQALGLQHQGVKLYEQGKYREAITLFEISVEDNSLSELQLLDVYNMIGYSYIKQGKFPEALEWYQKMVDLSPEEEFGWTELTYVHLRMWHLKTARQYLEHDRTRLYAIPAYLSFNLGYYYLLNKDYDRAEAEFLKSRDLQDPPVEFWTYHYAELLLATGRRAEGVLLLRQALKGGEPLALSKLAELGMSDSESTQGSE